jgi:glycosyltransferase involved in cell wall biosynthesis
MRVLINGLQAGNRSGTGRYTVELARALAVRPEIEELTLVWPESAPAPEGPRVRIIRRDDRMLQRVFFDHIGLSALCTRVGADIVHYPANFGPASGARNLVVTVHDLSFLKHPEWFRPDRAWYYRMAIRRTVGLAARLIADSQATADDLNALLGVPAGRIEVIPLGVSAEFQPSSADIRDKVRRAYGLPERFFLYVGTLEPRKNLPRLVEAWSRVADGAPDLVIAGRAGWKNRALDAAIARSAHRARIHRPGFVAQADLPALLSAADAFVWPSLFEGFGLPPLEAMACGAPVLTSNVSCLPEVVGDAALMVDPADTGAIADGLQRLATDAALRSELRKKGAARAQAFTWERTARLTVQSYLDTTQ